MATDLRERLGDVLDDHVTDDDLRALISTIMSASKGIWADLLCEGCGREHRILVEVPDANKITAAFERIVNQGKGRPVEKHAVEFTAMPLEQMTLEEIRARKAALLARAPELAR